MNFKLNFFSFSASNSSRVVAPVNPEVVGAKDDRKKRNTVGNYVHPNANGNWRTPANAPTEEASNQPKSNALDRNWRSTALPSQEVIRTPRGPPAGNEVTKGPSGFRRQAPVEKPQQTIQPSASAPSENAEVPKAELQLPQKKFTYATQQDLSSRNELLKAEVTFVNSPSDFYVQLSESYSTLEDMAEKLNSVYSGKFLSRKTNQVHFLLIFFVSLFK